MTQELPLVNRIKINTDYARDGGNVEKVVWFYATPEAFFITIIRRLVFLYFHFREKPFNHLPYKFFIFFVRMN